MQRQNFHPKNELGKIEKFYWIKESHFVATGECEGGNDPIGQSRAFLHHSVLVQILKFATKRSICIFAILLNQIMPSLMLIDTGRNVGDHFECHKHRVPVDMSFLGALDQFVKQERIFENSLHGLDQNG